MARRYCLGHRTLLEPVPQIQRRQRRGDYRRGAALSRAADHADLSAALPGASLRRAEDRLETGRRDCLAFDDAPDLHFGGRLRLRPARHCVHPAYPQPASDEELAIAKRTSAADYANYADGRAIILICPGYSMLARPSA